MAITKIKTIRSDIENIDYEAEQLFKNLDALNTSVHYHNLTKIHSRVSLVYQMSKRLHEDIRQFYYNQQEKETS